MSLVLGPAALTERVYVSQFSSPVFGLNIIKAGQPADADAEPQVVVIDESDPDNPIATLTATHIEVGSYEVVLNSTHTSKPGFYTLKWDYEIDGSAEVFESYIEIGQASPAYDNLDEDMKDLVDDVWLRFADAYDSPNGGPHAQVELQTHFNRGRIAQLMRHALDRLNIKAQPRTTYSLSALEGKKFPMNRWRGLLEQALYIETLKHLRRTYTEQPEVVGTNVARLDRRDYLRRWGEILQDEQDDFEDAEEHFKIAHMGLGRGVVTVAGGAYGIYGPTRVAHANAARPRFWARWYAMIPLAFISANNAIGYLL